MRNGDVYGTHDLVDRFMQELHTLVPYGTTNRLSIPQWPDSMAGVDAILPWTVGDSDFRLLMEVRLSAGGDTGAQTLLSRAGLGDIPIVLAPFLSPVERTFLESSGWSYWDATGNTLIWNPDPMVLVRRQGASRDPEPSGDPRPLESLKGRAASSVMVRLLTVGRADSVRGLSRDAGVSLGTTSRVVSLLSKENYLTPTGGGPIIVADRLALAERWAQDYSFEKTFRAKRYISALGLEGVLSVLQRSGAKYAVTGLRAAQDIFREASETSSLPASDLWLYTTDLASLQRKARLSSEPRRGDIVVAECDFFDATEGYGEALFHRVLPWRVVGDLMSRPGRHAAVGKDLAEHLTR